MAPRVTGLVLSKRTGSLRLVAGEEITGIDELPFLPGDEVVVREGENPEELVVVEWLPAPQPGVTLELADDGGPASSPPS